MKVQQFAIESLLSRPPAVLPRPRPRTLRHTVCIPPNRTISAQATLDGFRADCSEILGNIDIECSNPAQASDVHSLEALRMVGKISGYFRIVGCPGLRNFSHLSNLRGASGRPIAD